MYVNVSSSSLSSAPARALQDAVANLSDAMGAVLMNAKEGAVLMNAQAKELGVDGGEADGGGGRMAAGGAVGVSQEVSINICV